MNRIIEPLRNMGAQIASDNGFCPLKIKGGKLKGIDYQMPIASAQVKSCLLLAGLYADGSTVIREKVKSRDHTEIMLRAFGADISTDPNSATVKSSRLKARDIDVPGDISSAAFFIVLALISKDGELLIKNVGVNPTRTGIIDVLLNMGGHIELINKRGDCEPVADIYVRASRLKGTAIGGEIIPRLIDEIPVLATAAAYAEGVTVISGAEELKYKETNRIKTIAEEISKCGARFTETEDGLIIEGTDNIRGAQYDARGDHRIAMAAAVTAAFARGESVIKSSGSAAVSYPAFFEDLKKVIR
jgi:3-phosphoshikimate 1-carboxyvinyltransferase